MTSFTNCFLVGHVVAFNSVTMSFITFISLYVNWQAHTDSNGELRFWRPLFYQLKLWALSYLLVGFGLFMIRMFFAKLTVFTFNDLISYILSLVHRVILILTLLTFKSDYVSFYFSHISGTKNY